MCCDIRRVKQSPSPSSASELQAKPGVEPARSEGESGLSSNPTWRGAYVVLALEVASGVELLESLVPVRGVKSVLIRLGLRKSLDLAEAWKEARRTNLEDVLGLLEVHLGSVILPFRLGQSLEEEVVSSLPRPKFAF